MRFTHTHFLWCFSYVCGASTLLPPRNPTHEGRLFTDAAINVLLSFKLNVSLFVLHERSIFAKRNPLSFFPWSLCQKWILWKKTVPPQKGPSALLSCASRWLLKPSGRHTRKYNRQFLYWKKDLSVWGDTNERDSHLLNQLAPRKKDLFLFFF